ncbi:MAG: hypothetical protein AMJ73_06195 [candidate division Zixibacteria bacterium SM1_73]|nr:MAG: hypothetical protein AMJ73_06195 [candidate division Zixibacteria bacterium SM1_73]
MKNQCRAITLKGKRCKRKALSNDKYCKVHLRLALRPKQKELSLPRSPSLWVPVALTIIFARLNVYLLINVSGPQFLRSCGVHRAVHTCGLDTFLSIGHQDSAKGVNRPARPKGGRVKLLTEIL